MIDLSNITYVSIDGRQSDEPKSNHYIEFGHLKWLIFYAEYAKKYFNFGKLLIITPDAHKYKHNFIEFQHTTPFNYIGYSQFVINRLKEYINTEYCLLYQSDGAICNPNLWDEEYLEFDYIGAPWPISAPIHKATKNKVGNGGFSLRSRKFLEISSTVKNKRGNEDICLLVKNREYLLNNDIQIPDCDFARKFSVEYPLDKDHNTTNTFGFHKPKIDNDIFLNFYRDKILQEINYASKIN